ncbi:ABC-three component system middle component 1 [Bacillus sp. REN16]|uniref:ABC-three component system middle component 1 n=1 Tax=Bacillus sp. REN16 TaxID=2887296 RepID=UPI001E4FA98A|nr:ABC-three component system middle component 1 [Bacillus sp. REN16]MCC3359552.1 hypothetical protein [Bacillus sp. REN16]
MDKSKLLQYLDDNKFIFEKSEIFIRGDEEFIYCINRNTNISIVIKQYKDFDLSEILQDVTIARSILRENDINIWNSYYLILFLDPDSLLESISKIYSIERDSKGLRKYVILDEDDLYRMPFFEPNRTSGISLDFETNFNEIIFTENREIITLMKWIMEMNGDLIDLKKQKIKEKISEVYFRGGIDEVK